MKGKNQKTSSGLESVEERNTTKYETPFNFFTNFEFRKFVTLYNFLALEVYRFLCQKSKSNVKSVQ